MWPCFLLAVYGLCFLLSVYGLCFLLCVYGLCFLLSVYGLYFLLSVYGLCLWPLLPSGCIWPLAMASTSFCLSMASVYDLYFFLSVPYLYSLCFPVFSNLHLTYTISLSLFSVPFPSSAGDTVPLQSVVIIASGRLEIGSAHAVTCGDSSRPNLSVIQPETK
ncbi:hypothetical protein ACOMHN_047389 [Nucella lapillus]